MIKKINNIIYHVKDAGILTVLKTKAYDYVIRLKLLFLGFDFGKTAGEKVRKIHDSINGDAHENMPSSYYDIKRVLTFIPMPLKDISMLDIGCGSGRVLAFGMLCKLKAVSGVDLEDDAIKIAQKNCELLYNKGYITPYITTTADATVYDIPDGVNVLYIFNPFGATTMQLTVQNIMRYAEKTKEPLYILYRLAAFKEIFDTNSKFIKLHEEMHPSNKYSMLCVYKYDKQM